MSVKYINIDDIKQTNDGKHVKVRKKTGLRGEQQGRRTWNQHRSKSVSNYNFGDSLNGIEQSMTYDPFSDEENSTWDRLVEALWLSSNICAQRDAWGRHDPKAKVDTNHYILGGKR